MKGATCNGIILGNDAGSLAAYFFCFAFLVPSYPWGAKLWPITIFRLGGEGSFNKTKPAGQKLITVHVQSRTQKIEKTI